MKIFHCDCCGGLVFFENVRCLKCDHPLGFVPSLRELRTLEPAGKDTWRLITAADTEQLYRQCGNGKQHEVCNWMVPVSDPNQFCVSCRLNELIPDLSVPGNLDGWRRLEMAKRRTIYTILRLGLPTEGVENRPALRFKMICDSLGGPPVLTGHANGLITINLSETDDVERERRRVSFHEPYRTLLGHVRHEVAHYYWDRLIANSAWLDRFRQFFGDETADYGAALKRYYELGPPPDWQNRHVSAYSAAHPWEDWAETWAHYFHITDILETAGTFGITLQPNHPAASSLTVRISEESDSDATFDVLLQKWFPLTYALNSLNRSMGLSDVYPFLLSNQAIEKLRFVHEVVQTTGGRREPMLQPGSTQSAAVATPLVSGLKNRAR